MNKKLAVSLLSLGLLLVTVPTRADRYYRAHGDNPARLVGYILNPPCLLVEYAIMRPIHWVVSQPNCDIIFGHEPAEEQNGTYFEWKQGDFSPSIAEERKVREHAAAPTHTVTTVKTTTTTVSTAPVVAPPASAETPKKAEKRAEKKEEKRMEKNQTAPKGADKEAKAGCCSEPTK